MAAITDLAAASSVAATDNLVINQGGVDRRVTADKFALLNATNTFASAVTFQNEINMRQHINPNGWSLDAADSATLTMSSGVVFQFSPGGTFSGLIIIVNATDGGIGVFAVGGGVVVKIADGSNVYSTTKNSAAKTNVYFDGTVGEYLMQNNTGGSRTYSIFSIRLRSAS